MLFDCGLFILGLILLSWSADRFVYGASAVAAKFGISPMIIGLTIVAMGSSAPEIMVSFTASLNGNPDTGIGNAIGSNITNIALVLGATALFKPMLVASTTLKREIPLMVIATLLGVYFMSDNALTQTEGIILLVAFFVTIFGVCWLSMHADKKDRLEQEIAEELDLDVNSSRAILWLIIGMILLPVSANIMVDSAVNIARFFGMSDLVIGLTIIAIGTSLPELAASIVSMRKGEDDMAMGNIIGSNIFNILAVLAMPALIAPGVIDTDAAHRDSYVMLALTVLLVIFSLSFGGKRKIGRWQGGLLLALFIAYQFILLG
ncbi:calcium/sodium antiporter [Neptunicella marina]|uniref:Calcium/sodium antiporter n=1 Tax=Neptunicella marina TaxID=2125989 RepID=A0A8J6LWP3_9ALTE|nr:calcium/sodium antiporter [Neptunicella marina]MBC3765249.1 calcium/sodium antiporter [Neptunicella marina]